ENALWDMYGQMPWLSVCVAPILTFAILCWPIIRARSGALPLRIPILLLIATSLSIVWFALYLGYSIEHNSTEFTIGVTIENVVFAVVLWLAWFWLQRGAGFAARLAFCTLLHYWLFWCAFPWLGELI
ncbi:MAG TPA: hypothetical protein VGJ26_03595, partial [Pirellulales bacterium]